jgi:uncharacterized protein
MSAFDLTVPQFIHTLTSLNNILDKAAAHADHRKFDSKNYLGLRLAPDMLPFTKQVQIACDSAKGIVRLAGLEVPKHEDNEQSLSELKERVQKTIAVLQGLKREQFEGWEKKAINLNFPKGKKLPANEWLPQMVIPNLFFHVSIAYAILRSAGVEIGKYDYLGSVKFQDQ